MHREARLSGVCRSRRPARLGCGGLVPKATTARTTPKRKMPFLPGMSRIGIEHMLKLEWWAVKLAASAQARAMQAAPAVVNIGVPMTVRSCTAVVRWHTSRPGRS